MKVILADFNLGPAFLPFTYTKPLAELRMGILTFRERWELVLETRCTSWGEDFMQVKYPLEATSDNLVIEASLIPSESLISAFKALEPGEALFRDNRLMGYRANGLLNAKEAEALKQVDYSAAVLRIEHPWELFSLNDEVLRKDYALLTEGKKSQNLSSTNTLVGPVDQLFIEEGASVECSILNTETGPIYVGKNAMIMEGCIVRGGLAMCESAVLKMGAKIYGASTFGPYCKIGGEVNNAILMGYSNKGHEGFLGNSVLGEWCNLGADTNTSNLKNNYAPVKLWSYATGRFAQTGLQFCGLMMGDHSKAGINTMFNTGTVVGVSANIFGSGFPRNFVPSFSWGGASGYTEYKTNKAFETAAAMMARRGQEFDEKEQAILETVFERTAQYRAKY